MCSADAVDGHILYEELVSNLFFRRGGGLISSQLRHQRLLIVKTLTYVL